MKGAVAAGHRLTAEAGARVLEEGGNAVDACVAAAFAAWVAESPLTGPGAGGFALVLPAGAAARPPRRLLRRDARASAGTIPAGAEMHAIDVGFGGDSETTQVFRIGEASCAVPGRGGRARSRPRGVRAAAVGGARPAGDRARARRRRALAAAGAPARDPRPDPPPRARGPPALQPARRRPPAAGRRPATTRPGGHARTHRRGRGRRALPRRARRLDGRDRRGGGGSLTVEDLAAYSVVWRRPVRVALPGATR